MKYLFFFLFFLLFSLKAQAQGDKGYVVLLEGDTLLGNIKINRVKPIKFYQNDKMTVYLKEELLDYGYYNADKYISRPERIPPKNHKTTRADIIMMTGDTLYDCYVRRCDMNLLGVYIEYPTLKFFGAKNGGVKEIILYQDPYTIHIDVIPVKYTKNKGNHHRGYVVRAIDGAIKRYDSRYPFSGTIYTPSTPGGTPIPFALEDLNFVRNPVLLSSYDEWIVYKGGKIYRFSTFEEWKKIRLLMFAEDEDFEEYLKEKKINQQKIENVLLAYNLYWKGKHSDTN